MCGCSGTADFALMNATSCRSRHVVRHVLRPHAVPSQRVGLQILKAGLLVSPVPFGAGVLAPIGGRVRRTGSVIDQCHIPAHSPWHRAGAVVRLRRDRHSIGRPLDSGHRVSYAIRTGLVLPSVQGGTVVGMPADRYTVSRRASITVQRIGAVVGNAIAVMFVASVGPEGAFDRIFWIVFVCSVLMVPITLALKPGARLRRPRK